VVEFQQRHEEGEDIDASSYAEVLRTVQILLEADAANSSDDGTSAGRLYAARPALFAPSVSISCQTSASRCAQMFSDDVLEVAADAVQALSRPLSSTHHCKRRQRQRALQQGLQYWKQTHGAARLSSCRRSCQKPWRQPKQAAQHAQSFSSSCPGEMPAYKQHFTW
jgi:hypothetical protein